MTFLTPDLPLWLYVTAGGALGAVAGSFLATLVIRWPQGISAARGRSRCDACGTGISGAALVPVVSYLALRGRCARCDAAIDPGHIGIEAAAALTGGLSLWAAPGFAGFAGALFGWMLLALAVLDARHYWLPNLLTFPLLAIGLAVGAAGIVPPPLVDRAIGAAAGFAALTLVATGYRLARRREGLGGGDPKLFAAIGAWLGWQTLPLVLLIAALAGIAIVLWRMMGGKGYDPAGQLPFGTLLAIAAWPVWLTQAGQ